MTGGVQAGEPSALAITPPSGRPVPFARVTERRAGGAVQSHRRAVPLFALIGATNVVVSLLSFAALTSFAWSPLRGQETVAFLAVTVAVSLLAVGLWDRVVWGTRSPRRAVAVSLLGLWILGVVTGQVIERLVDVTGWSPIAVAVLLTPPSTLANYLLQERLRRHAPARRAAPQPRLDRNASR